MSEQRYIIEEDVVEVEVSEVHPDLRDIFDATHRLVIYDLTTERKHLTDLYLPRAVPLDGMTIIALARGVVSVHRAAHAQGYHLGRRALQSDLCMLLGVRS